MDRYNFNEVIGYDILEKIFKYLSVKDLFRAEAVCKTWQEVALAEVSKRNDVQSLILPVASDSEDDNDYDDESFKYLQNEWHVSDSLRSLPHVVLLFSDGTSTSSESYDELYLYYYRRLQTGTKIVASEVLGLSVGDTEIVAKVNLGVVITIPSTINLKINYYSPTDSDMMKYGDKNCLRQLAEEAVTKLITTEQEHNCFLFCSTTCPVFSNVEFEYSKTFITYFLNNLKKRCEPGTYSLWGGEISMILTNIDDQHRDCLSWSYALRLSGPAIKSWSIVLQLNLPKSELVEKLLNFKKGVQIKSTSTAIAKVPSNKNESFKERLTKTEYFRQIFSELSLTCIYESEEFHQFGVNTMDNNPDPVLEHSNSVAYLIITTN